MRSKTTRIGRRLACAVGASALLLSGAGFAAPAMAATEPAVEGSESLYYGDIDFKKEGTIKIHKHLHQDGTAADAVGDPATGEYAGKPAEGVAGVTFKVYKIKDLDTEAEGVQDLTTNAGWIAAKKFKVPSTAAEAEALTGENGNLELVDTKTTGANGTVDTKKLPVGAYIVVESDAPADITDRAIPFLVTLPYPDTETNDSRPAAERKNAWLYDVNVFPKNNRTTTISKTIEMQERYGLAVGSEVRYPVTAKIQSIPKDSVYKYFQIVDPMDPRFKEDSLGIATAKNGKEDISLTAADGTVTYLESDEYSLSQQGHYLTVSLTSKGLGKLKNSAGSTLRVVFSGKLEKLAKDDGSLFGEILNKAYLYSDTESYPGNSTPPSTPSTEPPTVPVTTPPSTPPTTTPTTTPPNETPLVKQFWGDVKILKVDSGDKKTGLQGAQFEVYPAKVAYPAEGQGCVAETAENAQPIELANKVDGKNVVVSNEKGEVHVEGLFVSDDQHDPKEAEFRCYVLKEVKAPTGYTTPKGETALIPVQVNIGETTEFGVDGKIENVKRDTPDLPLTGGKGVIMLMALGGILLIVAIGAGVVFIRRVNS